MSIVQAGGTHYMTFPFSITGNTRDDFVYTVYKNGEIRADTAVDITEKKPYQYVASFVNDGTDHSNWTIIISDPTVENTYIVESWQVRKLTAEKAINQIRTRLDSGSGFFGNK